MLSTIYRTSLILGLAILSCAAIVPTSWAFSQVPNPPRIGSPVVYDGGRRAQWRGHFFRPDLWWKSGSKPRTAPGQGQTSPGTGATTGSE